MDINPLNFENENKRNEHPDFVGFTDMTVYDWNEVCKYDSDYAPEKAIKPESYLNIKPDNQVNERIFFLPEWLEKIDFAPEKTIGSENIH